MYVLQVLFINECYRICILRVTSLWSSLSTSHRKTHDQSPPSLPFPVLHGSGMSYRTHSKSQTISIIFFKFVLTQNWYVGCGVSSDISIILCSHKGGWLAIKLGERWVHWDGYCFSWNVISGFCCICYELTHLWLHPM